VVPTRSALSEVLEQVGEAGALEVVDRRGVDPVVLAEDEAAKQSGLGRRRAALERGLGTIADAVGKRGSSAAAAPGELDPLRLDDAMDTEALEVGGLPFRRGANRSGRADLAPDRQVRHRLRGPQEEPAIGRLDADADLAISAPRHGSDMSADRYGRTLRSLVGTTVDRGKARTPDQDAAGAGGDRDRGEPGDAGRPQGFSGAHKPERHQCHGDRKQRRAEDGDRRAQGRAGKTEGKPGRNREPKPE